MPKRNTLSLALQSRQIFRRRRLLAFFMSLLTTLKVPLRRQNKSAREKHPLRFGRERVRACGAARGTETNGGIVLVVK